jgi:hypothetical protein
MAIRILFFFLLSLPAFAAKDSVLFSDYEKLSEKILRSESVNEADVANFRTDRATLEEHEYEEGKVDQIHEKVEAHLRALEDKKFVKSGYAFIDYSSWQENLTLKTPSGKRTLIATNQAECLGAGFGKRNARYHLGGEGCFLYGRGDVGSESSAISYKQSNVYGKGFKFTPTAGLIVSSGGAELGFKIPIIWFDQKFGNPSQAGYSLTQASAIQAFASIYARWPLGSWFLQSDIGKNVGRDLTLWSLGFGKNF